MEMEERPMLSQTGGEKGAHHCFDCDWLHFALNRDCGVEMPFIKLIQLVTSKEPGSFHQDCIFLNTDAVAEMYNCLRQEMDETPLKLQENKVKHQRLKV